ncbi:MAG: histidine--tRNA ligase [Myxococcota bacterium]
MAAKDRSSLQPPRGTRDFYPEDFRFREWLFDHFRAVAQEYGFEGVDAPVLEHAALFQRKAGEEIVDQLYHFELHDRHYALRGEFTPSLARMVMARAGALRLPLRWTAIPQCWRYERMTRGRRREHYQWNMDIWGEPSVTAEAELISAIFTLVDRLGVAPGRVRIGINSRALLEESLRAGVLRDKPDAFAPLCVVIDKLDKIGADAVIEQLCDPQGLIGLARAEAQDVVDWLGVQDIETATAGLSADSPARGELQRLFELLDAYGLGDRVGFDASLVRGLAYYTGIVFEGFDADRKLRAICGGGRYDRLLESLGGQAIPAAGFGFGDAVIEALLEDEGIRPECPRALDAVVFPFTEAERPAAIRLAQRLRSRGESVELVLGSVKLKRAMADADRAGAARIYLLGPDEVAAGEVGVRDLASGEQRREPLDPA